MLSLARRTIRAVKAPARDERIPRPVRALVGVGLLRVPGPFDKAAPRRGGALLACYCGPLLEA
jgi:hypothetical protein